MSRLLQHRCSFISTVALIAVSALISPSARAQGSPVYTIIHQFSGKIGDGGNPEAGLLLGPDGNFYGTSAESSTQFQGITTEGGVFKMTPAGALTVLHTFQGGSNDGADPQAPVILGKDGNFYGTTNYGGMNAVGTIFQVTPAGTFTILHSFNDGTVPNDGQNPFGSLIQGPDGNYYGTTWRGGTVSLGTVFRITPRGVYTILHQFGDGSISGDGANPFGSLILGPDGSLYGTTGKGGSANLGTVYKITLAGKVTILHSFSDGSMTNDGIGPACNLVLGADGSFYGTTSTGGGLTGTTYDAGGTVFKIGLDGTYAVLHRFRDGNVTSSDGADPNAALIQASDGNFYGTTFYGGVYNSGTIFKITPSGSLTILHSFGNVVEQNDGFYCNAALTQGLDGNLYGTVAGGGIASNGLVFRLSLGLPPLLPGAPAKVTAAATLGQVALSWTLAPGAQSYYVYRGTTKGGESMTPIASALTATSFVDTQVNGGTTYYYEVRAKSSYGASPYSMEVSATPALPTPVLTATAGDAQANLSWTASPGATGYNVYRGTTAGGESTTPIATGITGMTFTDTGTRNQVRYYYYVVAVNSASTSLHSNEVSVLPVPAAPAAPANLTATPGSKQISLSWSPVTGATGYKLYRGTTPGGESATPIYGANAATTTYINTGLTNGIKYYYKVAAINPGGISPNSNEASAVPAP